MTNFKIPRLSLLLVFIVIFASTCTASTAQPLSDTNVTPANDAIPEVTSGGSTEVTPGTSIEATAEITPTYLPIVQTLPKFIGIYLDQYWTSKTTPYLAQADQEAGKKHSSVGWFIDLEDVAFTEPITYLPGNNLYSQLEELWKAGYISFLNLGSNATAGQIINGERDREIGYAAEFYKAWVDQGGGRRAMIAPLQEMNGVWTAYGQFSTSEEFKQAYRHILDIFTQKGITRDQVWWVFAPNGYNDVDKPEREFENYYPGDDVVDIVGFSSYNYGYCIEYPEAYWRWESYPQIYEPYIARMQTMAPSKPIIIAETGSTAYYYDAEGNPVIDYNQMNQWLIDNYNYFAHRAGVIGVFYFSFEEYNGFNCEMEIDPNGEMLSGYVVGVSNPAYQYLNAVKMDSIIR
jgi:hypothetical protein